MNIRQLYFTPNNDKINILDSNVDPSFSAFPNMPLFKYGFYYYIHQTKNKMEMFNKPEFKSKDLHKIVNPFEDTVPQEEFIKQFKNDKIKPTDDINSFSIKYFQSDKIISRAFYKLWELLMMFPLIKDQSNFTSIHIAEAPGSFVQSVIYYRQKFFPKNQTTEDKYIATSIEPVNRDNGYVPSFNTDLNKFKQLSIWSYKNSDLTKTDIINKFISDQRNNKGDLITADGGFNWKDENYQEQEAYVLLLSEIYCALKLQKNGGNFVIKIFETFTELTVKMIEILKRFYKKVYIVKPLLSRPSNSERYIVCIDFNNDNKPHIDKIYTIIEKSNKNLDKYLVDIFPNYQINQELDMVIKLSSTQLSNEQHKQINEMISYISEGNYFGDTYRKYLMLRRDANDFWISTFYPLSSKDLQNSKKGINTLVEQFINITNKNIEEFGSKLQIEHTDTKPTTETDEEIKLIVSKPKKSKSTGK